MYFLYIKIIYQSNQKCGKVALFKPSKQSLTALGFFDKLFSPSVPAFTLEASMKLIKEAIKIFFIIRQLYNIYNVKVNQDLVLKKT